MLTQKNRLPRLRLLALFIAAALPPTVIAAAESPLPATTAPPAENLVAALDDATELSSIDVQGAVVEGAQESYQDERRSAANVTEALSAEQISRTGDADVATTLKRVTGLTVVDNKYVFVRGLGDRYSSVLLNGAQIPSPDPTRRVIPLDLFPTEILDGLIVQKSWSPDLPAEFGGGTVALRTRGVPGKFIAKMAISSAWIEGSTFKDGLTYNGGADDWTGYDSVRDLPPDLAAAIANGNVLTQQSSSNPNGVSPVEMERLGESLAGNYDVDSRSRIQPDLGFSAALGNRFEWGENKAGVLAALRYHNAWDTLNETRRGFSVLGNGDLTQTAGLAVDRTVQNIDLSAFVVAGADLGADHHLKSTTLLLRSSEDQTQVATGFLEDPADISRFTELEYIENQLLAEQLAGEHRFPVLKDLSLSWQYTLAEASRQSPNTRRYRYDRSNNDNRFSFSRRSDSNDTAFADLTDHSDDLSLSFKLPLVLNEQTYLDLSLGGARLRRDRDSSIRRFNFIGIGPLANDPALIANPSLDAILSPANIGANGFALRENTRATDNYDATQDLDAMFFAADLNWQSQYRFNVGLRYEDNQQQVSTFALGVASGVPVVAAIQTGDWLPALGFTWLFSESDQVRATVSDTVSRPDFRELSAAPYTDPELDLETIGNPNLKPSAIRHYDLRWEHYFSYTESLSVAAFLKNFELPIEKIQVPGTGDLQSLANAESAQNYGFEIDYLHGLGFLNQHLEAFYTAANFSVIQSNIQLGIANDIQTNDSRPLQGQSPYVLNLQLGYKTPDNTQEATLLYNVSGRRIAQVGVFGAPDIYEQSFDALDFNWRYQFAEAWTLKLRLRNLLDPKVEFRQGDYVTREFRRGRELGLTLEWQR